MKNIVIIVAVSFGLLTVSCNEAAASKVKKENVELAKQRDEQIKVGSPVISFEKSEHDFGTINEGDVVETVFAFTNAGKSELIITSAKGSCGCTVPEWPKEPIMPGESAEIKVKFNSSGKPNKQHKQVTLVTNTSNGKEILTIKAQVTPKANKSLNS